MARLLSTAFVAVLLIASSHSVNPGFRARVTQKGIDYANQEAVAALTAEIKKLQIPDQSGSSSGIDWQIKNIRVTSFQPPSSSISLLPGTGLRWAISNAALSLDADFHYTYTLGFIKISDGGSLTASMSGVSITINFKIGEDATGHPSMSSTDCSNSIGSISVNFRGGAAFIYNLFSGLISDKVKGLLQGQLCSIAKTAIDTSGEQQLAKLPMTVPLADQFLLDYRLVAAPSFTASFLETQHKGEIYWKSDQKEAPFSPATIPETGDASRMLYLWLSEYMANSLSFAGFSHQYLHYNITSDMLPAEDRGMLNTTCELVCIGSLIPQIRKMYPDSVVKMVLNATAPPSLQMTPGAISLVANGNVDMLATKPGKPEAFLLTMNVDLQMKVSAALQGQLLVGKVEDADVDLKVTKSAVGDVKSEMLNVVVNLALKHFVIPKINEAAGKGLVLPVTGDVQFINPQLVILQDNLMVATDLQYKGPLMGQSGEPASEGSKSRPLLFQPLGKPQPAYNVL